MIVSTESNCCISLSLHAACFVGWRPSPLRAACGASLRLESVRLTCLERFVAQERANRLVLTSVGFNCFPLCKKVFKTRLENCGPRAHARAPRAPGIPFCPMEICRCALCPAVTVSCLVLFCSVGLWVSCPIQVAPATSHSPQGCARTTHATCGRTRHLSPARPLLVDLGIGAQAHSSALLAASPVPSSHVWPVALTGFTIPGGCGAARGPGGRPASGLHPGLSR